LIDYDHNNFDSDYLCPHCGGLIYLDTATPRNYNCWKCNLYGGLKAVEQQLDIPRQLKDIGGLDRGVGHKYYLYRTVGTL